MVLLVELVGSSLCKHKAYFVLQKKKHDLILTSNLKYKVDFLRFGHCDRRCDLDLKKSVTVRV